MIIKLPKIYLIFLYIFLSYFLISCNDDEIKQQSENNYYINLNKNYKINTLVYFKKYGIQDILTVPDIRIHPLKNNARTLLYRTEFHNGTENGCLLILNKIEGDKVIPFFVLEELFYVSKNFYYQRVIKKFSYNQVEYELYEIKRESKRRILTVKLEKDNDDFKIVAINEVKKGFIDSVIHFSDIYDTLRNKIFTGNY